jgi:hypothetical protein
MSKILALFSFDRDWKKIEAFVGSKTVIQVFGLVAILFDKACWLNRFSLRCNESSEITHHSPCIMELGIFFRGIRLSGKTI